jgi:hypothetical protein
LPTRERESDESDRCDVFIHQRTPIIGGVIAKGANHELPDAPPNPETSHGARCKGFKELEIGLGDVKRD